MVRPDFPAALLAATSASANHMGSHENLSTLVPDASMMPASLTDTATAMSTAQTPSDSLPKLQERCQVAGHTMTIYASTATAYSFHARQADPVDGSTASGSLSAVHPEEEKAYICYTSTTTTTSPEVTTAAVVVESLISPHASTTAGPLTTHHGETYEPETTISQGGAGRLRPGFW